MRGPPPKDEPPARLFRSLLAPWPERPIAYRVSGAADVPLHVRALRGIDRLRIEDEASRTKGHSGLARGLVAASLWTPDGPAFSSPEAAGMLPLGELVDLARQVADALCVCSPMYSGSDMKAWERALEEGAQANIYETYSLASCIDVGFGAPVPRPDRYWGVPVGQLLDGHWMVYRAARAVVERLREKKA